MLQLKNICKQYKTGNLVQNALDDVSLSLRDNEFVAVLGPSGSGKTTLLNIIGGLDQYDSGELIINGISTKEYRSRDWDSYRNHTVGFVFQSYNLIPHQTLLSNVELALTISGVGRNERRQRAKAALEEVGLGDQMHKKPSQLSGGQMQRVAIARALVNNPDVLLADEPTGALDTDTSSQVMALLKEVAKDRLVVMVTHNPELADTYATRVIRLRDGRIQSDDDPYTPEELLPAEHRDMGKASMSLGTSLGLSFHNLLTKKARTILTAFAGSIGIIGIALILALSSGVNDYIQEIEEETLSEYPVEITSTGFNLSSMFSTATDVAAGERDADSGVVHVTQLITGMLSQLQSNDLSALKTYLDSGESDVQEYAQAIEYIYNIEPQIFLENGDSVHQVNPDESYSALGSLSSYVSSNFDALPENSGLYENQYDIVAGHWPENYNECILVLSDTGGISDLMLYTLGLRDSLELDDMIRQFLNAESVATPEYQDTYTYDDILGITYKLVLSADFYEYDEEYGVWTDKTDNTAYMQELVENGEDLKIVGIVQPSPEASASFLSSGIYYSADLIPHIVEETENSGIVQAQLSSPDVNVLTGEAFGDDDWTSNFDLSALLSIDIPTLEDMVDADALAESLEGITSDIALDEFSFDELPDLSDFSLDLENLDLSDFSIDLSSFDLSSFDLSGISLPSLDMSSLLSGMTISISTEDLADLVEALFEEYESSGTTDYSAMGSYLSAYLSSDTARAILAEYMTDALSASDPTVTTDQLESLITEIMTGFQSYADSMGYTDGGQFGTYLAEYLQTAEAAAVLNSWASENMQMGDITLSSEQMEGLAQALVAGYTEYALEYAYPDFTDLGDDFTAYLNSDSAQRILTESIAGMIDFSSLESQLSGSLGGYIDTMIADYGTAIADSLAEQLSGSMDGLMDDVIEELSDELADGLMETISDSLSGQLEDWLGDAMEDMMGSISDTIVDAIADVFQINGETLEEIYSFVVDTETLSDLLTSLSAFSSASYESNLSAMGYADFSTPDEIDIYPLDFNSKEEITAILEDYNTRMAESGQEELIITYTDMVGTLMSSVTDIVNQISYILIAFVAISLVVSSIMIGVITYISVLERKKEIGILRAIGASRRNISSVFNAETFIIGLFAGLMGVIISLLILIPGNIAIHALAGSDRLNAVLNPLPALLLVLLSVVLTIVSGLIPSRAAARSDPVEALRNE